MANPLTSSNPNEALPRRMRGQNIICFAKDWTEDPTSCNHVLHELAKSNKVLWLNSISTRAPKLTSGRDFKKTIDRVTRILGGARQVGDQMWLYTPMVLPFHHHKLAVAFNRWALRLALKVLRRRLGMRHFQLWTFMPTSADYVDALGEDLLVEIFLACLESPTFQHLAEPQQRAWLWRVVHNKLVDFYRKGAIRQRTVNVDDLTQEIYYDEDLSPERLMERSEEYLHLHKLVKALPQNQQQVLRLRLIHGLRSKEIARRLGKSEQAIRALFSRALNLLRSNYRQRQGEYDD